ncbi:MAG: hypothetical protein DRJ64_06050 [Thermoprotei archaeon]|nr:MAG: hypothetical protein DRJ64_06050 [Thermoprotei archaeon]
MHNDRINLVYKRFVKGTIWCLIIVGSIYLISYAQEVQAVKIIKYNKQYNFIVIDQGKIHGLTAGMDFVVVKNGAEIGKIEVVKVKDNISACDILELMEGVSLKEGDVITIYPFTPSAKITPQPSAVSGREVPRKEKTPSSVKKRRGWWAKLTQPFRKMFREEGEEVSGVKAPPRSLEEIITVSKLEGPEMNIDVYANKDITFYKLRDVLDEHKIIVTQSNRLQGTLTGFKLAPMGIGDQLFADFRALQERRVVYNFEVKPQGPQTSKISVSVKLISYNKNDQPKYIILKTGRLIDEAQDILSEVKVRAEEQQQEWGGENG